MREFGTLRLACVSSARALLAALEMLLLLLWRHVAHYAGAPGAGNGPPARGAVVSALRLLGGGADPAAFRREVRGRVASVVGRVEGLEMVRVRLGVFLEDLY